jgi:hypothetical protein
MDVVGVEGAFGFLKQVDANRLTIERRLQRELQEVFDEYEASILEDVQKKREPDYEEFGLALQAVLIPFFVSQFVEEALSVSVEIGIGFDPAIINTHALQWARTYSYELITGLTDTTREVVRGAISSFIETPGMTIGDVKKLLEPAFGQVRSQMISVTETTRAYSAATSEMQRLVEQTGLHTERIWLTANDEHVCEICAPLNNRPESAWAGEFPDGPPAHVNCRCGTELRVIHRRET